MKAIDSSLTFAIYLRNICQVGPYVPFCASFYPASASQSCVYFSSIIGAVKKIVQFNVMGPFVAKGSDNETIEFGHRKVRALLAYLAVERSRSLAREHLATLLWSRTGDERARHNLRQALSRIRGFCPDLIDTVGDGVALRPAVCTIDVVAFTELARSDDAADLRRALDFYRGDLLEGYNASEPEYQDWLQVSRGRLRKLACEVADRLAAMLRDQGRQREAIEVLNRLLRIDQANESAHRDLMELLARTGRRSEALRQYQECAAALARELDAEPGSETKRLLAEIRQSQLTPPTADVASASMPETAVSSDGEQDRPLPRKLVAVLYADVASYSHLTGEDEDATHRTLRRYLDLFDVRVVEHRGRVVHYAGDAVLAQFDAVHDALSCALTVQRELDAMNRELDESRRVRFRIGVNSGDVIEDRGDIYGDGVNVAARLEALAEPESAFRMRCGFRSATACPPSSCSSVSNR